MRRNDEVPGPSPLLLWAGSSLCWNLSLQRVFSYITGFFMSNLGADIVDKKKGFRGCCLWLFHWCTFSFSLSTFSFRAPWTPYGMFMELEWWLFSVRDPEMKKNSGMEFSTANLREQERKEVESHTNKVPCSAISVLLHPDKQWGFLWYKHIDLHPPQLLLLPQLTQSSLCYYWKVYELLLFTPFSWSPSSQVLISQRTPWRKGSESFLLWKPGVTEVFFSLQKRAFCSLKTDEIFQNTPKWSTLYFFDT